jgi:hypothetical protein
VEGVHKPIATSIIITLTPALSLQREREVFSYCTIIKNPYDPYLNNNPTFQLFLK